jgi:LL-diaminopimelate aminotransferase
MVVGNPEVIDALFRFKSNLDSGIPQAIQYAAIEALNGPQDSIEKRNLIYQKRRDKLVYALNGAGLEAKSPSASFYVWAKVPPPFLSEEFARRLLDDVGVVVTPGRGYGQYGERYIRLSLTIPDEELDEGINRIRMWQR